MTPNFERFDFLGSSFTPKISLRNNGSIGLSQGAIHKFGLKDGEWYVVLYYDKEDKTIGIKPTRDPAGESATRLNKREVTSKEGKSTITSHISARSFLEYYDIKYRDKTRSYLASWDPENEMIVVDLKQQKGA